MSNSIACFQRIRSETQPYNKCTATIKLSLMEGKLLSYIRTTKDTKFMLIYHILEPKSTCALLIRT